MTKDTQLLGELTNLYQTGNFNAYIKLTTNLLERPVFFRKQIKESIIHCLKRFKTELSPHTIDILREMNDSDISKYLLDIKIVNPDNKIGEIVFPVTSSIGHVRKIIVTKTNDLNLSAHHTALLDKIGICVYDVLEKTTKMDLFWDPSQFSFSIIDHTGKEDPLIEGRSLELPLSLALYSCLIQVPVPYSFSATGQVTRDGNVLSIKEFMKKIAVLTAERHYIKQVVISERQPIQRNISGVEIIRINNIKEAVKAVFKENIVFSNFIYKVDIENEIRKINKQYSNYFIDTCLKNIEKLMKYLKSIKCPVNEDKKNYHLYICYWRKGSCLCHQGKPTQALICLEKAKKVYHENQGIFDYDEYLDLQISYSVVLKDIFNYNKAEKIHYEVQKELKRILSKDHHKGKNLSTQSQLYLAQNRFEKAVKLQKKAIKLINQNERYRNINYLAQIYVRYKRFNAAKYNLDKAYQMLKMAMPEERKKNTPFLDWVASEYYYKKGLTLANPYYSFNKLKSIALKYPQINWYVPGLINKFYSLSILTSQGYDCAKNNLNEVVEFFENKPDPVHKLIALSIHAEVAIYFIKSDNRKKFENKINLISSAISKQHKNINNFFSNEHSIFLDYLKNTKKINSHSVLSALQSLKKNIPY